MKNKVTKTSNLRNNRDRFYIAYGSNLNLQQMKHRCPSAEVAGKSLLRNWRLMFRGSNGAAVATIERSAGHRVPVLVWRLQPQDEQALDHYEGWPHLYRKETLRITLNDRRIYGMIYIMNEENHPYGRPSSGYFDTIIAGYKSAGFDEAVLSTAVADSTTGDAKMDEKVKEQILAIRATGEVNMFDAYTVQYIANRKGYYELVLYLQANREEYIDFILNGGRS